MHKDEKSTEGMTDYNRNSAAQQQIVDRQATQIRDLVGQIGLADPEFRVVDYGCGPGVSTINVMKPAIEAYCEAHPGKTIVACHMDQPGNDWNTLFALATGPDGYLQDRPHVRMEASIGSFFAPSAAAGSVSLGTCFTASHWFSRALHVHAPDAIWYSDLQGDAYEEFAAFARNDWMTFLRCRANELHQGGCMLVSTIGAVPDASEANGTAGSGRGIYRALHVVSRAMADEGLLDRKTLDNFVFSLWFMTEEEARQPIEQDAELSAAFDIERVSVEPATMHPSDLFLEALGDPVEYARLNTGYTRAFANSTLRKQLFEPSTNSPAEADRLENEFYRRLDALYREHTSKYACEIWNLTVVLRRR